MLCNACCMENGEGRTGNIALCHLCCCHCYTGTTLGVHCILHWMKHQGCKRPPCSSSLSPSRELRKLFALPEWPKKNKCNFWIPACTGVKHLSFCSTADHLFCYTQWITSSTQCALTVWDWILLQPCVLSLGSQVQLLLHLGCHRCLSGPGCPSKLLFQRWWGWSTLPTERRWDIWLCRCSGAERSPSWHQATLWFICGRDLPFSWDPDQSPRPSPLPPSTAGAVKSFSPTSLTMQGRTRWWHKSCLSVETLIQGKVPGPQTFSSLYSIQKKRQSSFSSEKKTLIYTGRISGIKDSFLKSSLKVWVRLTMSKNSY